MRTIVSKINGILNFQNIDEHQSRNKSTIWCIKEADKIYNWKDFDDISIYTGDIGDGHILAYTKSNYDYINMVPDFWFDCWVEAEINDYNEQIRLIDKAGKIKPEINKAGWIGVVHDTVECRKKLFQIGNENKEICDITNMKWNGQHKIVSLQELVQTYSILIDVEGYGYSGRLKSLLWSHRPVLLVDRPYKEYFFEHLQPWVHYIPVKRDLTDLIEKVIWCLNNYDESIIIAENAYNFSKQYLTREACFAQWNKVILNQIQFKAHNV